MPIGGKDAFLSKVTFRRESKWYSKTKQELKDMATIEKRANLAAWQIYEETILSEHSVDRVSEIITEKMLEQKALDIDKACEWLEKELQKIAVDEVKENFLENNFNVVLKSQVPNWLTNFRKAMEG